MSSRTSLLLFLMCLLLAALASGVTGGSYRARLSLPEGIFLVASNDPGPPRALRPRPPRAVVVVLDGLGWEEARGMRALALLGDRGQCRKTDVGSLPMSRPVYAVLSSGLEQDRTGVRDNQDAAPLAAETLWAIARERGLQVAAISELSWWRELAPTGFDRYDTPPRAADYLQQAPRLDLTLVHPVYLDEIGHAHGAGSPAYAAAVARADRELLGLLSRLDLRRDLLLVTADHGHTLRGGHGGLQDRVRSVLTCVAGPGVRAAGRGERRGGEAPAAAAFAPLRSTTIAPLLSVLLGLRLPQHLRAGTAAGDDDLDSLPALLDPAAFPTGYLADRQRAVAAARASNQAQLRAWLPAGAAPSWRALYGRQRLYQGLRGLPTLLLLLLIGAAHAAAHRRLAGRDRAAWSGRGFVLLTLAAVLALHVALRGSFDMSAIPDRERFISFSLELSLACGLLGGLLHLRWRRSPPALLVDGAALLLLLGAVALGHPLAFGWRVGFPLPPPPLYFLPYLLALAVPGLGVGILLAAAADRALGARWRRQAEPNFVNG